MVRSGIMMLGEPLPCPCGTGEAVPGAAWVKKTIMVVISDAVVRLHTLFLTELAARLRKLNVAGVMKLLRPLTEPISVTIVVVTCVLRQVRGTG